MPPALFDPTRDELLPPGPEDLRGGPLEADPAKGTAAQPLSRLRPDPAAEEVWQGIVAQLEDEENGIDGSSARIWFGDSFGTALLDRTLTVAVPNPSLRSTSRPASPACSKKRSQAASAKTPN